MHINKKYMKLYTDYYTLLGSIMISETPFKVYNKTVTTLKSLLDEIDPAFFIEQEHYENIKQKFANELRILEQNRELFK